MYEFIPATEDHVQPLIDNINPDIAREMKLLKDIPLKKSVSSCISRSSEAWTALYNGEVICIFGIRCKSLLSRTAYPWLLTTNLVKDHKRNFLKGAKISINKWLESYDVLENYIPAGLDKLVRWVEWAGFVVEPSKPVGQKGRFLHRIEMRKY
jgi:hypothetical protein